MFGRGEATPPEYSRYFAGQSYAKSLVEYDERLGCMIDKANRSPEMPAAPMRNDGGNAGTGKVLIAYFTHEGNAAASDVDAVTSATGRRDGAPFIPQGYNGVRKGNIQVIADYIAKHTSGTLFAIQTIIP